MVHKPSSTPESHNPHQPVAYDQQGRPLYAHPPTQPAQTVAIDPLTRQPPQVVYMTRPAEPVAQHISDKAKMRHEESKKAFPGLNLSEGEYVISAVRRHPIGLLSIWAVVALAMALTFIVGPILLRDFLPNFVGSLSAEQQFNGGLFVVLLAALFILGGVVATVVYRGNRFFLTNESVIQNIQTGLVTQKEQTISLTNIEDASFRQTGLIQTILNYGALRLSTEGDETTYRFSFVANPKRQVDLLNNAVEAFKNGRPVDPNEEN